uniref:Pentatricopeptide repeat-containing protein At1g61870, mitochondrial n=1 Tax=Anthurium amnicola TaxID=1678845 RepID=A0A1D1YJY4_9ARAE
MASTVGARLLLPAWLRRFSSASAILNPADSAAPLTGKQKSRAAISLLKSEKDPARIVDICHAAALTPDSHLDRIAFSLAVSSLAASASFSFIRSLLDGLLASRPDLQNQRFRAHAIVLFGQAGMLDDAIRVFKDSRDPPTVRSLNALLFACVLAKKHDEVGRIFLEFPREHGISPDLDTYNTVIKAFCESGSSRSVYSILDEMGRKGIQPNMTSYSTLLAGFYREQRFDDVGKVLDIMKRNGCIPGIGTYNVRIQSLCKLRRPAEARALLEGMLERRMKPNAVTYYHLIYGFCKEGDLEEAKRLFREMGRKGCVPGSSCYFTLIYYLCQGGDFETALGVCRESMDKNWIPCFSIMKALVKGLMSSSKVDEAREIMEKVKGRFSSNSEMWKEVEESLAQTS